MRVNPKSWPIVLLLSGAAGAGFVAGDSEVVSDADASAVRLIKGGGKMVVEKSRINCDIKGNISIDSGERIYHMPGDRYYDDIVISRLDGERYFCSEVEARRADWRRSRV